MVTIKNNLDIQPSNFETSKFYPASSFNLIHSKIISVQEDLNNAIKDEDVTVLVFGSIGNVDVYTNSLKGRNHEMIVLSVRGALS